MKNVFQQAAIECVKDIKHALSYLLESLKKYLVILDYHGNINPQSMTAIPIIKKEKQKENLEKKKVCIMNILFFINGRFQFKTLSIV